MLKLNLVVSWDGVLAFQLTAGRHRQIDVTEFVRDSMSLAKSKSPSDLRPVVVLDNSPKNRSVDLMDCAQKDGFGLVYITPGTPQQNMAEQYFLLLKREFSNLNSLASINSAQDGTLETMKVVLETMKVVKQHNFNNVRRMYLHELLSTFRNN